MAGGTGPCKKCRPTLQYEIGRYASQDGANAAVWHFVRKLGKQSDTFNAVQQAFNLRWGISHESE